jgi:ribosomal protein S18 acetylase RimI-like enzyme
MNSPVFITAVSSDEELSRILRLQQLNLPQNISPEEAVRQGFVTVEHSFEILKRMNERYPHFIAKVENEVVGYALVMTKEFRNELPVLIPMFEMIDRLEIEGQRLAEASYFVMGQICVAKNFRGMGIFDRLYRELQTAMKSNMDWCLTEVASRNVRSLKAHYRAGFQTLHRYTDPRGEVWEILYWKL